MRASTRASSDQWFRREEARRRAQRALVWSAVATLGLYLLPLGGLLGYPLMLLSTLVHELGHGLTAMAVGERFLWFALYPDGSGVAQHSAPTADTATALVAAGGLVGPALVSCVLFLVGRSPRASRVALGLLAAGCLAVTALVVRNPFGIAFVSGLGLLLAWVAVRRSAEAARLVTVFLAVQLALSVFSRGDYLFTAVARTGAGVMPSDTAHIAEALGGTYWMWGLGCGALSVLVVALGLLVFRRSFVRR